ncbi:hypothetical protein ACIBI3_08245 [Actinomadura luteofluorescens]|uniref:hypothetical protein n=1 Tax=Actinomadura luteofluorescens TaxID=46163 RepID=UPI003493A565
MFTTALAVPAAIVIALTAAARIPAAAAELIRACLSLIQAVHELRAALAPPRPAAARPAVPRTGRPRPHGTVQER